MKKRKNKKVKLNDGHYLEAMDRLHVVTCMMEEHLINHPIFTMNKDLTKLVNYSIINLLEAYQRIGNLAYQIENEKKPIHKVILRRRKDSKK